jgi:hypothetical protein
MDFHYSQSLPAMVNRRRLVRPDSGQETFPRKFVRRDRAQHFGSN